MTTILEARKILGKLAKNLSDEEIQKDIDSATLLKDLFFEKILHDRKMSTQTLPNVP